MRRDRARSWPLSQLQGGVVPAKAAWHARQMVRSWAAFPEAEESPRQPLLWHGLPTDSPLSAFSAAEPTRRVSAQNPGRTYDPIPDHGWIITRRRSCLRTRLRRGVPPASGCAAKTILGGEMLPRCGGILGQPVDPTLMHLLAVRGRALRSWPQSCTVTNWCNSSTKDINIAQCRAARRRDFEDLGGRYGDAAPARR
jgi:hypothetical protein